MMKNNFISRGLQSSKYGATSGVKIKYLVRGIHEWQ